MLLGMLIIVSLLSGFAGTSISYAVGSPYDVTLTRTLLSNVSPGQVFNVTVNFTSPAGNFNAIGLSDFAPMGWTVAVNDAWNSPNNEINKVTANRVDYMWFGPYNNGTGFTVVYQVTVPANAATGTYYFTNTSPTPRLEYYVDGGGPYIANISGQNQVTVTRIIVSGISPSSGSTTGGTSVTITGSGFVSGTTVTIGGNAATISSVTATSITAVTPSGTAGAKDVVVTTPGGSVTLTGGFTYVADNSGGDNGGGNTGGGGGGGGGSNTSNTTVYASIFGSSSSLTVNSSGFVQQAFTANSADGKMSLTIPANTLAQNGAGTALTTLTQVTNSNPPAPPSGNIIGLAIDLGPSGATFSPPITFVYHYTAADFGTGLSEADLTLAFYDTQTGTWIDLKQKYGADYVKIDPVNDTITVLIPHFTTFAVMGKAVVPTTSPMPTATPLALPSLTPVVPSGLVAEIKPSAVPSPSSIPAPLPPTSTTVSPSVSAPPPSSPSLASLSVVTPAAAASPSQVPFRLTNTFNWAWGIGIAVTAIAVVAVIMVVRRKSK